MSNHRRPLVVATAVLVLGVATSLAGNLQAINLDNARPGVGAYVSAVFWPLALFAVVELLIHTPWLANWRDRVTKGAVLIAVASVAAWISYWHLANVLSHYGYDVASRYAGPVAVDAALVLAALALDRVVQARRVQDMDTDSVLDRGGVQPVDMDKLMATTVPAVPDGYTMSNGLPAWTGPLDTELSSAAQDVDRAIGQVGQEMASETESWLAGLAGRVQDTTSTPPVPVVQAVAKARTPRVAKAQVDTAEAYMLARIGRANGLAAGDIAELLAGHYGVNPRTVRREGWWVPTMAGRELDS